MRNFIKTSLIALISTVLLNGCGSSGPKDVTETFVKALQSGDLKTIEKNSTPDTFALINMSLAMQCGNKVISSCMEEKSKKEVIKDYELISESENNAVVNVKTEINGNIHATKYDLVKTENGWKVNLRK